MRRFDRRYLVYEEGAFWEGSAERPLAEFDDLTDSRRFALSRDFATVTVEVSAGGMRVAEAHEPRFARQGVRKRNAAGGYRSDKYVEKIRGNFD